MLRSPGWIRWIPVAAVTILIGSNRSEAQFQPLFPSTPTQRSGSETAPQALLLVERAKEGHALFERDWLKEGPLEGSKGDGLGPMYNAVSCVACHRSGAPGGAADNKSNVDLLSVELPPSELRRIGFLTPPRQGLQDRLLNVHPGFLPASGFQTSLILHTYSVKQVLHSKDAPGRLVDDEYAAWRSKLLNVGGRNALSITSPTARREGLNFRFTQRNTPALFGAGLIDSIPDHMIVAIADEQKEKFPETQGRVPRDGGGRVGRFGWRGQVGHLHDFVLAACANELGLQVPGHSQPPEVVLDANGTTAFLRNDRRTDQTPPRKDDLTAEQCLSLTTFVAGLLPPTRSAAGSITHARDISAGETLFNEIGCADCHRREVGPIDGIYSDLLLHDMGAELSDPLGANPDNGGSFGGYYGSSLPVPQIASASGEKEPNLRQEWRTPPLWGVGDSAPYLHDGRAGTLEEAIRLHGGQGRRSARYFRALKKSDRLRVLEFLSSLAAPRIDGTQPAAVVHTPAPFGSGFGFISGSGGFFNVKP